MDERAESRPAASGSVAAPPRGLLARVRSLLAPSDEIDAQREAMDAQRAGYDCVRQVTERRKVALTGFISSMVFHPRSAAPSVEADLFDGTGTITLIWLGREHIAGIEPGTRLAVSGFAADRSGHRVMYNPRYEILAAPGEEEDEEA